MSKVWQIKNLIAGSKKTQEAKDKEIKELVEATTEALQTRFISFDEGCLLILQYL